MYTFSIQQPQNYIINQKKMHSNFVSKLLCRVGTSGRTRTYNPQSLRDRSNVHHTLSRHLPTPILRWRNPVIDSDTEGHRRAKEYAEILFAFIDLIHKQVERRRNVRTIGQTCHTFMKQVWLGTIWWFMWRVSISLERSSLWVWFQISVYWITSI